MAYDREALHALIRERALKFGDFTLVSGKKAKYYLDCKQVTLDAEGARWVGEGILDVLGENLPDSVGGMSIGADPITGAVVTLAGVAGKSLKGFMVRKEPKGHGTNKYVDGPVEAGQTAVIVEDVVTTGGSSILAIDRCEEFGLKISQVIAIVDRMEGGRKAFADRGVELTTLFTVEDFGIERPAD